LDTGYSGCRRNLDYLLIRRTLKHAAVLGKQQIGLTFTRDFQLIADEVIE
jgi:hypothetical protein